MTDTKNTFDLPDNRKVGLALGGGAVLGAAHIGVLKALEELEIEVGWITGTSIGAMVAGFYAFGFDLDEIKELAIDINWSDFSGFSFSKFGLLSNEKMLELIESKLGKVSLEDAKIPLGMVCTNVSSGEKAVLTEGNLAQSVMASTCIPGIFKPVEIDGELYVDGGVVENIPISALSTLGASFSVAVDLNAKHTYERPGNIFDVLMNSFHFTMQTAAKFQAEEADILIEPDLSEFDRINTDQCEELIQKGYDEAMGVLKTSPD
jgi:NTE family protein